MTFARSPARQLTGYEVVHASREFRALKRQFSGFAFPATAAFLAWYFLYVLLATFAPGFMRVQLFGDVNVGLCLGLLQFASTLAVTVGYRSWSRRFTPQAARLRARLEEGAGSERACERAGRHCAPGNADSGRRRGGLVSEPPSAGEVVL